MTHENGTKLSNESQEKEKAFSVKSLLTNMNQPQCLESNLAYLQSDRIGSTSGLLKILNTDPEKGIDPSSVDSRRELFGSNYLPSAPRKTFLELFVGSFDDETVRILMAAAIVSLAVGVYEDPSTGYVEGVAILTAVFIVAIVTALNDYQKETQFRALSKVNDNVETIVIRGGRVQTVFSDDLVVGDLICVEAGHAIPCDGVLIKADGLEIDESALTGEPLDVDKSISSDPFVLSGCITTAGSGTFVAIAVGASSQWGIIKAKLEKEQSETPLQEKLDAMANMIGTVGMAAAAATFVVMMIMKIVVQPEYLKDVGLFSHALSAFIIGVTIVVVAVPEGLPLAVTISLAYSTKKMLADNNLIRHLSACETMGNATNICSDKTGTLTENRMTVVKGVFANSKYEDIHRNNEVANISGTAKEIILQCIGLCSTAYLDETDCQNGFDDGKSKKQPLVIGNKTEGALLLLATSNFLGKDDYKIRRLSAKFGHEHGSRLFPFSSLRKCMSVIYKHPAGHKALDSYTLYHKGAAEKVLGACNRYLDSDGTVKEMTEHKRLELERLIATYASQALRCIALSHRDNISSIANPESINVDSCANLLEKDMILDALVGIIDPLRSDVIQAVKTCQRAGIFVRMVTGDNIETAKAIAKQAGILTNGMSSINRMVII
jgi:Ca2+-transporting ATPase